MSTVSDAVASLASEFKLLGQLVYRNHNQHSSTELFSYLKSLKRTLAMLSTEKLLTALKRLEESIREASHTKLAQSELKGIFIGNTTVCATLHLLSEAIITCLSGGACVRRLLSKKVFLPLYSMLLAVLARIFTCLAVLHDHFYEQGQILHGQLQHLEKTQPRLSKIVSEYFQAPNTSLDALTVQVYATLHRPTGSATAAMLDIEPIAKVTAIPKNVSSTSLYSTGSVKYASSEGGPEDTMDAPMSMDEESTAQPERTPTQGAYEPVHVSASVAQPTGDTDYDAIFQLHTSAEDAVNDTPGAGGDARVGTGIKRPLASEGGSAGGDSGTTEKTKKKKISGSAIKLSSSATKAKDTGDSAKDKDRGKVKGASVGGDKKKSKSKPSNSSSGKRSKDDIDDIFGGL